MTRTHNKNHRSCARRPLPWIESMESRQLLSAALHSTLTPAASAAISVPAVHVAVRTSVAGTGATKVSAGDVAFLRKQESTGLLEIDLGSFAAAHAGSSVVAGLGSTLETDATASQSDLASLAAGGNLTLSGTLGPADQASENRLEKLTGVTFDRAYATFTVSSLRSQIAQYFREAQLTSNTAMARFAEQGIAALRSHLTLAVAAHKAAFQERLSAGILNTNGNDTAATVSAGTTNTAAANAGIASAAAAVPVVFARTGTSVFTGTADDAGATGTLALSGSTFTLTAEGTATFTTAFPINVTLAVGTPVTGTGSIPTGIGGQGSAGSGIGVGAAATAGTAMGTTPIAGMGTTPAGIAAGAVVID
jgi:hypothetical protein